MLAPLLPKGLRPIRGWLFLAGPIGLALVLGGWFCLGLAPVHPGSAETETVEIEYGSGITGIARLLHERGLLRDPMAFRLWAKLTGGERAVKAGSYALTRGMSAPRILALLRRGHEEAIRVTIPEGTSLTQIAAILDKHGVAAAETFLALARDPAFAAEVVPEAKGTLEGFLFPDTYYFSRAAGAEGAIRMMAARFHQVFTPAMRARAEAMGRSVREIVILASLVEGEAKHAEERPLIASVFYNRLRLGMPLQSCATVQYALGKHKERLLYEDLQVASPYNTYLHAGLPPGPIGSPGLASLQAALHPAKANYLYFVAKPDGTHVFSSTYREHLRAQTAISRGEKAGGR
ncbi:MAG: endolytic transglycosylase MltG [Firmicutes bacterium]|nr:endolytic transglycosylase MltG [Bacillota bacterium]